MRPGTRAVVTGGAGGIGRAVAEQLLEAGCAVAVVDMQEPVSPIGDAEFIQADLSDQDALRAIAEGRPPVDYLVNAAGVCPTLDIYAETPEIWDKTQAVNTRATFFMIQALAPTMNDNGAIVNIASIAGLESTNARTSSYNVSKAGVIATTKTWARELAPRVRVNCVCPGVTDTPMLSGIFATNSRDWDRPASELVEEWLKKVPLGRLALPSEIADVICYLLSDRASYITGQSLSVCGGYIA